MLRDSEKLYKTKSVSGCVRMDTQVVINWKQRLLTTTVYSLPVTEPATIGLPPAGSSDLPWHRQKLTVRLLVPASRELLIVQSSVQRDLRPSLVPASRKDA